MEDVFATSVSLDDMGKLEASLLKSSETRSLLLQIQTFQIRILRQTDQRRPNAKRGNVIGQIVRSEQSVR